jgi:hypothetical protein
MIIVYIKENEFFKNVDPYGNIFEIQYPTRDSVIVKEDGVERFKETYDNYIENGFAKVELDDQYKDCNYFDFNEDLTFSVEKYNARKQKENNQLRINEIKARLEQLSQDLIQAQAGAVFEDLEERKAEFQTLHNELRVLLGKEPREYNKTLA